MSLRDDHEVLVLDTEKIENDLANAEIARITGFDNPIEIVFYQARGIQVIYQANKALGTGVYIRPYARKTQLLDTGLDALVYTGRIVALDSTQRGFPRLVSREGFSTWVVPHRAGVRILPMPLPIGAGMAGRYRPRLEGSLAPVGIRSVLWTRVISNSGVAFG